MPGTLQLIAERKRQLNELKQIIEQMECGRLGVDGESLKDLKARLANLAWELADLEVRLARATVSPWTL